MKAKILGLGIIILVLAGVGAAYQLRLFNRPPKADFEIQPKYINPTDETLIKFVNKSTDPDGDPLSCSWYVDGRLVNTTRDCWTKLSVGNHIARLVAYDGKASDFAERSVTVDRSWVYPTKKLKIPLKSIVYDTGTYYKYDGWNNTRYWLNEEQFEREIVDIINVELGCNAIRLTGTSYGYMFKLAEIAMSKGKFDVILISPRFISETKNETLNKIVDFAKKSEELRLKHKGIVFSVGNELSLDTRGIGSDSYLYRDRVATQWDRYWKSKLDVFLGELSCTVSKYFKGNVTYCSGFWELPIDWDSLGMTIISVNDYIDNRSIEDYESQLKELKLYGKLHGKPVHITEFGCATFEGAFEFGGLAWREKDQTHSQEAQADGIRRYVEIFDEVRLDACTLHQFYEMVDDDRVCFGIMKFSKSDPPQRKLGFYMYRSYVVTDSSPTTKSDFEANHIIPVMPHAFFGWLSETTMTIEQIQTPRNEESEVRVR